MRGQRVPPQARPSRSSDARRYNNDEVEVVVSPTGRQRLQAQQAEQARRTQPEYSASKYKVYERPQASYSSDQQDASSENEGNIPGYVSTEDLSTYVEYMRRQRDAQMHEMQRAQKELDGLRLRRKELEELERLQKSFPQQDQLRSLKELSDRVAKLKNTQDMLAEQKARLQRYQVPVASLELMDEDEEADEQNDEAQDSASEDAGMIQRLYELAKKQSSNSINEKREAASLNGTGDEGVEESGSVVEFSETSEAEDDEGEDESELNSQDDPDNLRLNQFVRDLDTQLNKFDSVHERANFLQHLLAETENSISTMKSSPTNTSMNESNASGRNAIGDEEEEEEEEEEEDDGTAAATMQLAEIYAMLTGTRPPPNGAQKISSKSTRETPSPTPKRGSYPSPSSARTNSNTSYLHDLFRGKGADLSTVSLDISNLQPPSPSETQDEEEYDQNDEEELDPEEIDNALMSNPQEYERRRLQYLQEQKKELLQLKEELLQQRRNLQQSKQPAPSRSTTTTTSAQPPSLSSISSLSPEVQQQLQQRLPIAELQQLQQLQQQLQDQLQHYKQLKIQKQQLQQQHQLQQQQQQQTQRPAQQQQKKPQQPSQQFQQLQQRQQQLLREQETQKALLEQVQLQQRKQQQLQQLHDLQEQLVRYQRQAQMLQQSQQQQQQQRQRTLQMKKQREDPNAIRFLMQEQAQAKAREQKRATQELAQETQRNRLAQDAQRSRVAQQQGGNLQARQQQLQQHQQELLRQLQQQQHLQQQLQQQVQQKQKAMAMAREMQKLQQLQQQQQQLQQQQQKQQLQQEDEPRENLDKYLAWRERQLQAEKRQRKPPPPPPHAPQRAQQSAQPTSAQAASQLPQFSELIEALLTEISVFLSSHEEEDSATLLALLRELRSLHGPALKSSCYRALVAIRSGVVDGKPRTPADAKSSQPQQQQQPQEQQQQQTPSSSSAFLSRLIPPGSAKTPGRLQNHFISNLHYESPNKEVASSDDEVRQGYPIKTTVRDNEEDDLSSIPSNYEEEDEDEDKEEEEGEEEDEDEEEGEEEEEEEGEEGESESGSFIALTKNIKKKRASKEKAVGEETEEAEGADVNMKQMASLAKEYTDEIINNEIIIKELDLHLMAMLEEEEAKVFTQANVASLVQYVSELMRSKGLAVDVHLTQTIHERLAQFTNGEIHATKNSLVQAVSDILYDEMVFHKVLQKVDESYLVEINQLQTTRGDLQTEEERLVKQREQDLLRLQRERWSRFSAPSPSHSVSSSARATKGGSDIDDDIASETNSFNELASTHSSSPWDGSRRGSTVADDDSIGVDDLPNQRMDIPNGEYAAGEELLTPEQFSDSHSTDSPRFSTSQPANPQFTNFQSTISQTTTPTSQNQEAKMESEKSESVKETDAKKESEEAKAETEEPKKENDQPEKEGEQSESVKETDAKTESESQTGNKEPQKEKQEESESKEAKETENTEK